MASLVGKARAGRRWLASRRGRYVAQRARSLVRRYGFGDGRSTRRIEDFVARASGHACPPTFPTPGRVVERRPEFFRRLVAAGAELAVHGYDHVDFRMLPPEAVRAQLTRAARAYTEAGIPFTGFRCPYLGWSEELEPALPEGLFSYGSNRAVDWGLPAGLAPDTDVFRQLAAFYRGVSAATSVSVPRFTSGRVEVPVSLPDDLQLLDGLKLGPAAVADVWIDVLERTHARGELFAPLFHPETLDRSGPALERVLGRARELDPPVWLGRLDAVAAWWSERAAATAEVVSDGHAARLELRGSERVTFLARNCSPAVETDAWDRPWERVAGGVVPLADGAWPLLGCRGLSPQRLAFLRDQGYVVEDGEAASRCALVLEASAVGELDEVELLGVVEESDAPLVKVGRWPSGTKSALALAGDLDALGLRDYLARLRA